MQRLSDDTGDADGALAAASASSAEAGDVLASLPHDGGYEFKRFTFEEGPLGMKFGGTLEHTTAGVEVAIVTVSELLRDSQAAKLGVPVGSILKLIGRTNITQVKTMAEVLDVLAISPRPVEIAMTVPRPKRDDEYDDDDIGAIMMEKQVTPGTDMAIMMAEQMKAEFAADYAAAAAAEAAVQAEQMNAEAMGNFVIVTEKGTGFFHFEFYADELNARRAAAKLWCCWVLFCRQGGALNEVTSGGLGFACMSIRNHVLMQISGVGS